MHPESLDQVPSDEEDEGLPFGLGHEPSLEKEKEDSQERGDEKGIVQHRLPVVAFHPSTSLEIVQRRP